MLFFDPNRRIYDIFVNYPACFQGIASRNRAGSSNYLLPVTQPGLCSVSGFNTWIPGMSLIFFLYSLFVLYPYREHVTGCSVQDSIGR